MLFIDAKDEVTRKNSFSYLEDKHIKKISNAYRTFADETEFAKVVTISEIQKYNSKLSVALYTSNSNYNVEEETDESTLGDNYGDWMASSDELHEELNKILEVIGGPKDE